MSFILDYLIQRGRLTWLRSCRRQRPVRLRKRGLMRGYFITKPGCYQMSSLLPPFCKQIDTCGTPGRGLHRDAQAGDDSRSEEHTSELQSRGHLVCRLLLE